MLCHSVPNPYHSHPWTSTTSPVAALLNQVAFVVDAGKGRGWKYERGRETPFDSPQYWLFIKTKSLQQYTVHVRLNYRATYNRKYSKIPKISPGTYIFQKPFLRGLFSEGTVAQKGHTCKLKMLLQTKNFTCKLKMLLQIKNRTCKLKIVHAN